MTKNTQKFDKLKQLKADLGWKGELSYTIGKTTINPKEFKNNLNLLRRKISSFERREIPAEDIAEMLFAMRCVYKSNITLRVYKGEIDELTTRFLQKNGNKTDSVDVTLLGIASNRTLEGSPLRNQFQTQAVH